MQNAVLRDLLKRIADGNNDEFIGSLDLYDDWESQIDVGSDGYFWSYFIRKAEPISPYLALEKKGITALLFFAVFIPNV